MMTTWCRAMACDTASDQSARHKMKKGLNNAGVYVFSGSVRLHSTHTQNKHSLPYKCIIVSANGCRASILEYFRTAFRFLNPSLSLCFCLSSLPHLECKFVCSFLCTNIIFINSKGLRMLCELVCVRAVAVKGVLYARPSDCYACE